MPPSLLRRRLGSFRTPAQMLRTFREADSLFGLIGVWHDSRAVVGFAPSRRLPQAADPFAAMARLPALEPGPAFGGGWVGSLGYQLGRRLETLPEPPPRPVPVATFTLSYYDHVLVRDDEGWWFEALIDDSNAKRIHDCLESVTGRLGATAPHARPYSTTPFVADPDADGHRDAVVTTLRHLAAGDIFQANVCRRFEADFSGDPLDVFCAGVERLAPSYAAFLRTQDGSVASFSPELFLKRTRRRVTTAPIKGTAPLDSDVDDLARSAKNRAENMMIVDLMRNDLGRVCVPGSVRVGDVARPERRAGVWHLISDVVGSLAPGVDDAALLRATFPPGSVTGAPKVRAMEVIAEVEATGREIYTGAIGYASPVAGLELNVAIRTLEFARGRVWFGAGGGVVVDSTPDGELVETVVKAAPLVSAIGAQLSPSDDGTPPHTSGRGRRTRLEDPDVTATSSPEPSHRHGVGLRRFDVSLLLIDNYDSFVYNLDQYVRELGAHTTVVRNDAISAAEIAGEVDRGRVEGIIVSPGPGLPGAAGVSNAVVRELGSRVPILGVCLGHQCIGEVYGARIVRAASVVHGKASVVHHDGRGVFTGLPRLLVAGRYHSLVVSPKDLPEILEVTARTSSGVIMGVRHRRFPVEGVQFHPESALSSEGHSLLANFLDGVRGGRPRRAPVAAAG
jgi:anthranilate synthase/aminodeoxychorismate synthase-like glutamine amidotransferase